MIVFKDMNNSDKQFFFASVIVPVALWWFFTGYRRYSTKGMR